MPKPEAGDTLIEMKNQPDFSVVPELCRERIRLQWQDYVRDAEVSILPPAIIDTLPGVWAASAFVAQSCLRTPALLSDLAGSGELERPRGGGEYARTAGAARAVDDETGLMQALRYMRRREMVRIAWRDLAGWAALDETLDELSALADAMIDTTVTWLEASLRDRFGDPRGPDGEDCRMVVLGMGKLGGGELNFSSDIDLILAYPYVGHTDGRRTLDNASYFKQLAQDLIRVLDQHTEDGFVYRVDTRLRPFGDSGPLAMSFAGLEDYYQLHGRDWERYALIKARPVAGDQAAGDMLLRMLKPFVYRRYLDYNTYEALRGMKRLIEQQVARKGLEHNIKLGPGGIREIEFIAQAFQLIRAGHEPSLQSRALLPVLERLGEADLLPAHAVDNLCSAYGFLRRVENRLQAAADQQTHDLPRSEEARILLAFSMGYADWGAFEADLEEHRRHVREQFESVFSSPQVEDEEDEETRTLSALWQLEVSDARARELLVGIGIEDAGPAVEAIRALRQGALYRGMGDQGRRRLGQLMPLLLKAVSGLDRPGGVLMRVLEVVEAIAGRVTYIALLVENPMALSQLIKLCAASPWITHQVARHPILLDDLLDPRTLNSPPGRDALEADLAEQMTRVDPGDQEREMDELRRFKQTNALRVAAAEVSASLRLMRVSDHLTHLAEVILERALDMAWTQMTERYGRPVIADRLDAEAQFAVIAYGKLGGIEMSYASDLDLVFLHDGSDHQSTDGARPVDHHVFFVRLAQRVIHLLSTQTAAGSAYEVDLRLRPSGRAGLLVTSLDAFRRYQEQDAWTWEQQALVRARPVAGSVDLGERFGQVRAATLGRERDPDQLRTAVADMREKMRAGLLVRQAGRFDIKQGEGGISDIEFMCQHAVLRWTAEYPALARYTDNIRILEGLRAQRLIDEDHEQLMADAYRAYRSRIHALALQEAPALADDAEFADYRRGVIELWHRWLKKPA